MTPQEQKILEEANKTLDMVDRKIFANQIAKADKILELASRKIFAQQVAKETSIPIIAALGPIFAELNRTTKMAINQYIEAIRATKLDVQPKINVTTPKAEVEVKIPEIKIPEIKLSTERIEQAIIKAFSKIKMPVPKVEIKEREFSKEIKIKGFADYFKTLSRAFTGKLNVGLEDIDRDNPLHVVLVDPKGRYYKPPGGGVTMGGRGGGAETKVEKIDLSSQCNSSTTAFSLGKTVKSIILTNLNGTLASFTLNAGKDQITLTFAPDSGEELEVVAII